MPSGYGRLAEAVSRVNAVGAVILAIAAVITGNLDGVAFCCALLLLALLILAGSTASGARHPPASLFSCRCPPVAGSRAAARHARDLPLPVARRAAARNRHVRNVRERRRSCGAVPHQRPSTLRRRSRSAPRSTSSASGPGSSRCATACGAGIRADPTDTAPAAPGGASSGRGPGRHNRASPATSAINAAAPHGASAARSEKCGSATGAGVGAPAVSG
jgi:hypothetical protein